MVETSFCLDFHSWVLKVLNELEASQVLVIIHFYFMILSFLENDIYDV